MQNIAILGSSGFVGKALVHKFRREGWSVIECSRSHQENAYRVDLFDRGGWRNIFRSGIPNAVISTSWYTNHGDFWNSHLNKKFREATVALAEDCFKNGVERFIGIGSMTEYGTKNHSKFYEQIPEMPIDSYSNEKIETCREISKLSLSYRKNFQWLRIFQAFGKGEKRERFIPSLIEALFNETEFLIGTPENVLDWIHIDEISSAIFHSVANIDLQVIDVGTGLGQSVLDVSRKICTIGGFDSSLIKYSSQDPRLRKELVVSETSPLLKSGWRPEKSLEIHLEEMLDQKINS